MKRFCCFLFVVLLTFSMFSLAYADEYTTKVAGVTFDNNDGTNRQKHLAKFYLDHHGAAYGEGSLLRYYYEGSPAIYVLLEGKIIGNIPADEVENVLEIIDQIDDVSVYVSRFYAEDDMLIYFARVTMNYSESKALISNETVPSPQSTTFPKNTASSNSLSKYITSNTFDIDRRVRDLYIEQFFDSLTPFAPYIMVGVFVILYVIVKKVVNSINEKLSSIEFSFRSFFENVFMLLIKILAYLAPVVALVVLNAPILVIFLYTLLCFFGLRRFISPILFLVAFIHEINRRQFDYLSVLFFVVFGMYAMHFFSSVLLPVFVAFFNRESE